MAVFEDIKVQDFVMHLNRPEWGIGSIRKLTDTSISIWFPLKDQGEIDRLTGLEKLEKIATVEPTSIMLSKGLHLLEICPDQKRAWKKFHETFVKRYLHEHQSISSTSTWVRPKNQCVSCKTPLHQSRNPECGTCTGMVCRCGVCLCGWKFTQRVSAIRLGACLEMYRLNPPTA